MLTTPAGRQFRILDLPGAYSLNAVSIDEEITRDVVLGTLAGEQRPDMIVCVSDATNLKLNLRLVLEVKRLGLPMMLALNMTDLASKRGITIDVAALQRELGMPVVNTVAVRRGGASELLAQLEASVPARLPHLPPSCRHRPPGWPPMSPTSPPRNAKCAAFSPPASASRRSTRASTSASIASSCTRCGGC
jgi:Fe2+ transport system protein B